MIKIKKLTPPQIAALREAFPHSVDAGILTTTASIATFRQVSNIGAGIAPVPSAPWTRDRVRNVVAHAVRDAQGPAAKARQAVVDKLDNRPDLIEEA